MIGIGICDTDLIFVENLQRILKEYFGEQFVKYSITTYYCESDLLICNLEEFDLFFLEVVFDKGNDGIELARKIREQNQTAEIVFITYRLDKAYQAFEVNALRYLPKPLEKEGLIRTLELFLKNRKEKSSKLIILNQGQKFLNIPYSKIVYFETLDRKLKVITTNKTYIVDNKINEIEQRLEDCEFFRIHKSYLINLAYVKEHDRSTVTLLNGDVAYISRLKTKQFKEKYQVFIQSRTSLFHLQHRPL
ncbi:LytR/AlgR family response regulator transcription factor [Anaerosporobacter sp.]